MVNCQLGQCPSLHGMWDSQAEKGGSFELDSPDFSNFIYRGEPFHCRPILGDLKGTDKGPNQCLTPYVGLPTPTSFFRDVISLN